MAYRSRQNFASDRRAQRQEENHHRFGRDGKQFSASGERLDTMTWNGAEIIPVNKCFPNNHPAVQERTPDECDRIRLQYSISVTCENGGMGEVPKPITSISELPFADWAYTLLHRMAWTTLFGIQVQAWPAITAGHDVIGISSTGSGKTAAYVLPMLHHISHQRELEPMEGPIGLVLVPCRELCDQTCVTISSFGQAANPAFHCMSLAGGADLEAQRQEVIERVQAIVATPRRLRDFLDRKFTNLKRATFLVLDEADAMLKPEWRDDVQTLVNGIRPDRQVVFFSATWTNEVETFAKGICNKPIKINVGNVKLSACRDISQEFWCPDRTPQHWRGGEAKAEVLSRALALILRELKEGDRAIVFVSKTEDVFSIVEHLNSKGISCEGFGGSCTDRERLLERFRYEEDVLVLVATQVLGRGHDFPNVKYVVNYDMPHDIVDYIHRIGRTGRKGTEGFSLTLLEEADLRFAKKIVTMLEETGRKIPPWLRAELPKHKQEKYWAIWNNRDTQKQKPAAITTGSCSSELAEFSWEDHRQKQIADRREKFLKECGGQGAARPRLRPSINRAATGASSSTSAT